MLGPVPLNWLQRAMELGSASLSVGIILWYVHGLKKSKPFKMAIQDLAKLINCSWPTAFRGLKKLENRGLISIKRQIGAKHTITIEEIIEPPNSIEKDIGKNQRILAPDKSI